LAPRPLGWIRALGAVPALIALTFASMIWSSSGQAAGASTTGASVQIRGYDLAASSRVHAPKQAGREPIKSRCSAAHDDSAGESSRPDRVSPSAAVPRLATNSADDVLRLGTKDSWGNSNTLARHFRDHGADFAASSADDYARQASEFLQRPGSLTKIDADGVIRVYDPGTNTFGAYNPNGTTRTFFKPSSPTYWDRQPGVPPQG